MKTNTKTLPVYTQEGKKISHINPAQELQRLCLTCLLWEDTFYAKGDSLAKKIADLIPKVKPELVADLAIKSKNEQKLRHLPLFLVREMARHEKYKGYVSQLLPQVIKRADELCEFLALYWKEGKCPLSAQVKKGLAKAFTKFDEYSLAKYSRDHSIKLKDVLFLCHAKPETSQQEVLWKKLIQGTLETPNTWEVKLSAGGSAGDKKKIWSELINNNELGGLATLRNLRNMKEAGVEHSLIKSAIVNMKVGMILPFQFIAAAKYIPQFEAELEQAMFKCLASMRRIKGHTALIVDTSPSMWMSNISEKSEITRFDAAAALAMLLREVCESVSIYAFNNKSYSIPNRRGFALRDALLATKDQFSAGELAVAQANKEGYDKIICITDGEWHSVVNGKPTANIPLKASQDVIDPISKQAYMLNIHASSNGVGYGKWNVINGWSEGVLNYIQESELHL